MIDDPKGVFPAPFVSGVDENNCIDKDTLTENIVVMVPRYQTPGEGDLIKIYFGGTHVRTYIITAANLNRPILVEFPPADITAGNYEVKYEVTDGTGTTVTSDVVNLMVTEGASGKPVAPSVEGATGGILDLSSLVGGKLTVDIPSDNGNLQTGDGITVIISDGTTQHQGTHLVVQDVNPHHVMFNASLFGAENYQIYYIRSRNGVEATSEVLLLTFVTQVKPQLLPLPLLPQAMNGVIALNDLTEDVVVEIPVYSGVVAGDIIQVWVGCVAASPHIVVQDTLKMHFQTMSPASITPGRQMVYYTVTRLDGTLLGNSPQVEVNFARDLNLSEALLTGESGGLLDIAGLETPYIEMVVPAWEGIARGDEIHGFIGKTEATPHVVVQDVLDHHTLRFDKTAFSTGDYEVYYVVKPINGQPSVVSPRKNVTFTSVTPESVLDRINAGEQFRLLNDSGEYLVPKDYVVNSKNEVASCIDFATLKDNACIFCKKSERYYVADNHLPQPTLLAVYLSSPGYENLCSGEVMFVNDSFALSGGDFFIDFEYAGRVNNITFMVKTSKGYWNYGLHNIHSQGNPSRTGFYVGEKVTAVKLIVEFC